MLTLTEVVILAARVPRRPIVIEVDNPDAWGSY